MSKDYRYISQDELDSFRAAHLLWLEGKPGGKRADLSNVDFIGEDYLRADLYLRDRNFRRADFSGSNLNFGRASALLYSDLRGADFFGAILPPPGIFATFTIGSLTVQVVAEALTLGSLLIGDFATSTDYYLSAPIEELYTDYGPIITGYRPYIRKVIAGYNMYKAPPKKRFIEEVDVTNKFLAEIEGGRPGIVPDIHRMVF